MHDRTACEVGQAPHRSSKPSLSSGSAWGIHGDWRRQQRRLAPSRHSMRQSPSDAGIATAVARCRASTSSRASICNAVPPQSRRSGNVTRLRTGVRPVKRSGATGTNERSRRRSASRSAARSQALPKDSSRRLRQAASSALMTSAAGKPGCRPEEWIRRRSRAATLTFGKHWPLKVWKNRIRTFTNAPAPR